MNSIHVITPILCVDPPLTLFMEALRKPRSPKYLHVAHNKVWKKSNVLRCCSFCVVAWLCCRWSRWSSGRGRGMGKSNGAAAQSSFHQCELNSWPKERRQRAQIPLKTQQIPDDGHKVMEILRIP